MAWTTPRDWTGGETITATICNTHIRDNFNALTTGASFTPTWGNTGTANSLGNGTLAGTYISAGKLVLFTIQLTWGSTTSSGNGDWTFTLPVTSAAFGGHLLHASYLESGVGTHLGGALNVSTTVIQPVSNASPVAGISATNPFTWGTADVLSIRGWYLAA